MHGNAGSGETHDANLAAFKSYKLIPSRLVSFKTPDISTRLFGQQLKSPVILAPVGVLSIFHRDKEIGVAKAANETEVPYSVCFSVLQYPVDNNDIGAQS